MAEEIMNTNSDFAPESFHTQMCKLAVGLANGKYSMPQLAEKTEEQI